ncbi:restriction endonuclease [Merdimonas faecis]|uniref:restriction endonuclease n=1 Tax=Merdimonas faecis TaxID=1653435 RepID=UPI0023F6886C|nr:restriction endonuclease [Merdimonas faecis]
MAVPQYFKMHKPILKCLSDRQTHTMKELKVYVINYFQLTEEEVSALVPSGTQTYLSNRIGWARTYLKKAGLIESPARAVFRITEEGMKVVRDAPDVIDLKYLLRYDSFREFVGKTEENKQSGQKDTEVQETDTPDDVFEAAFKKINQSLADDVLTEVMKLSPIAFEKMVLDLMTKMGYGTFENAYSTTPKTNDEGIDGIIMEDKLGFGLIYVQIKHWGHDHSVGRPEVQAFVGAIAGKGGKGLFVTTSKFTKQAIEYAKGQHIILMDGEKLAYNMIEHDFGVSTKKIFSIKALDMDLFEEYQEE